MNDSHFLQSNEMFIKANDTYSSRWLCILAKKSVFFFFMKCSNNIHTDLYEILGEDHMNPVVAE